MVLGRRGKRGLLTFVFIRAKRKAFLGASKTDVTQLHYMSSALAFSSSTSVTTSNLTANFDEGYIYILSNINLLWGARRVKRSADLEALGLVRHPSGRGEEGRNAPKQNGKEKENPTHTPALSMT